MIIVGSANSNRQELLIQAYKKLVDNGENPHEILFLALNAYKKNIIQNSIRAFFPTLQPNVQTYLGLCYNSILANWDTIQRSIKIGEDKPEPLLCGLEASQNMLLDAVKEVGFKDYNSKINLVHQLLRRHSLIVGNNLTEEEVEEKSKILNEVFAPEAKKALDIFKAKTLELRAFDYIRQQSLFKFLYENTNALSNIKHILIDDYDEQTPACTDFFKYIKQNLNSYTIAIDPHGSTRMGYLCADTNCTEILKNEKEIIKAKESPTKPTFEHFSCSKRLEMLQNCAKKISELLKNGVFPEEISVITPLFDSQMKFTMQSLFAQNKFQLQFISGSEKLAENPFIKSILSLLKLINNSDSGKDELSAIFPILLKIPTKYAISIIKEYEKTGGFLKHDFLNEKFNKKYEKFLSLASKIKPDSTLAQQMESIYAGFISGEDFCEQEINDFYFLEKQIKGLELTSKTPDKSRILNQLENSIIAENETDAFKLQKNAIIVGTPQKIVDFGLFTKYQFWLDITSEEWVKQDTGTIYNAWVFARAWLKPAYSYEDGLACAEEKSRRLLRKLCKLCSDKVFTLRSAYNSLGQENFGGIDGLLDRANTLEQPKTAYSFVPRQDQREVLNYTSGKMAVAAVPGAGKTTVLQALIAKLLSDGINSENIFVLTYMESAAKNIRERLSAALPELEKQPNISTIHGLALRIIKENGNFSYAKLDENFEICDDLERQRLIREAIGELNLKYDEYEKYEKAISVAKFLKAEKKPKTKELIDFSKFYRLYQSKLAQKNLIDYDDMLLFAVKILEENPQILSHYQQICQFIIEDEAQDSSAFQQRLIELLAGQSGNIVRFGDINQAITSTFTNADTQGFRDFIAKNNSVEMNQSQRCAKEIFELANSLIDISKTSPETQNAFYDIKMQEVKNKNPKSENAISASIFETEKDEKNAIIKSIKDIFKSSPNASVAILLRNNFQVNEYSFLLKENGIATISRTDCLEQTPVFNVILSILRFTTEPWNNFFAQEVYKNIFKINSENLYLSNLEVPFITTDTGNLDDENLISLHWELNYWLSKSSEPFEQLALEIGEAYCSNEIERSNLYIIAEIIRRTSANSQGRNDLISKLEQVAKRPTIAGLKLFTENDNTISTLLGGKVQIMTMHKAKGDEFDYVFIPELTENSIGTSIKSIKTGNFTSFFEEIKSLNPDYKTKNALKIKQEILEESLRLLYVAITRAKLRLYVSCALKYKKFGRLKPADPSKHFENLFANYIK